MTRFKKGAGRARDLFNMGFIRLFWRSLSAAALLFSLTTACTDTSDPGLSGDGGARTDSGIKCSVDEDQDRDGIKNGEEGCLSNRDSDGDGTPDWQDFDSDGDGVTDQVEAGVKGQCPGKDKDSWPCDSDGDGLPDYIDVDSDGDTLLDGEEDANGDGQVGCCIIECGKPTEAQKKECILTEDGCGSGQTCENGKCKAALAFSCSNGETSPSRRDTYNDGKFDNERGTFVCREATEDRPQGRKPLQFVQSPRPYSNGSGDRKSGDWHLALELTGQYRALAVTAPKDMEAAAVIDYTDPQSELMAGFVVSIPIAPSQKTVDLADELRKISVKLQSNRVAGSTDISERTSGSPGRSHDEYPQVTQAIFDISGTNTDVSTARNDVIATLLDRAPAALGTLPTPYGGNTSEMVLKLAVVFRYPFKMKSKNEPERDKEGHPVYDDSRDYERQLIVIGGLAARSNVTDPNRNTGFLQDDLAGATVLARYAAGTSNECDVGTLTSLPVADIIWVIDESGSMDGERDNVRNNANSFFSRALASGLDFRMCVTGMMSPTGSYGAHTGVCGSRCNPNPDAAPGGQDRFLLANEQTEFSNCIYNPPYTEPGSEHGLVNAREAVLRHLPRASNDPSKIRPNAKLVIIIASDEGPEELRAIVDNDDKNLCHLSSLQRTNMSQALQPYLDLFKGVTNPEAAAIVHVIGGLSCPTCAEAVAWGYMPLADQLGGQKGDICQNDLGSTLQAIIDSIAGAASPVTLDYVPIASSLAVAMDGVALPRSRTNGFDYRANANSLVFINVTLQKGSEVVASYKRWVEQIIPG
jgi:hypothetical protein